MPVFKYQRHNIYYELHGSAADPVVTFVNGLSMRTAHWAPYFDMLPRRGCRVLSYDLPGQGFSSKPVLGMGFDDHAEALGALHEHLEIESSFVLGISFGGVVALKYALSDPERVRGLMPASTFSELNEQLRLHAYNLYQGLTRLGFEFYLDLLMPLNFTNEFLLEHRQFNDVLKRAGVAGNDLYGIQNIMESLAHFESITPELSRITCPTMILNGEYDFLTPRSLHDIIRREIANSRLYVVAHMAHAFTMEVPAVVSRLVGDFVAEVESGRWQGDQSVWITDDDVNAPQFLHRAREDHLRFLSPAEQQTTTSPAGEPAQTAQRATAARKQAAAKKRIAASPGRAPKKVK